MKRESIFGLVIAGLAGLILWLLNRKGLLHESVSSKLGGVTVTTGNTITPDPATGFPQYDTSQPSTVPAAEAFAVKPIDISGPAGPGGNVTQFPTNPLTATCPVGYSK